VVLKMAVALVKQIDQEYDFEQETDQRIIRLTPQEMDWLPDKSEVWNAVVRPKHWETPERLAAVKRESEEIRQVIDETGLPYYEAFQEYVRRRKQRS